MCPSTCSCPPPPPCLRPANGDVACVMMVNGTCWVGGWDVSAPLTNGEGGNMVATWKPLPVEALICSLWSRVGIPRMTKFQAWKLGQKPDLRPEARLDSAFWGCSPHTSLTQASFSSPRFLLPRSETSVVSSEPGLLCSARCYRRYCGKAKLSHTLWPQNRVWARSVWKLRPIVTLY